MAWPCPKILRLVLKQRKREMRREDAGREERKIGGREEEEAGVIARCKTASHPMPKPRRTRHEKPTDRRAHGRVVDQAASRSHDAIAAALDTGFKTEL